MKKTIAYALCILCFCFSAFADDPEVKTSVNDADALVWNITTSGNIVFRNILIVPDGTNDLTISVYDALNASDPTRKIISTIPVSGTGGPKMLPVTIKYKCRRGIYVDVTSVGTYSYTVFYSGG